MLQSERLYLEGLLKAAQRRQTVRFTRFVDPAQQQEVQQMARGYDLPVCFWAGYPGGERCLGALGAADADGLDFPLRILHLQWDGRFTALEHRDLLGALMSLGLERDSFGDILPEEDQAFVFVIAEQAEFVCRNLNQAKNAALTVTQVPALPAHLLRREVKEITTTVMSLRLDAVLAPAFGLSREKAAAAVRMGLVKHNHQVQLHCDARVQQGDVFSLRGKGRAVLKEVGGASRKGRTFIQIDRY